MDGYTFVLLYIMLDLYSILFVCSKQYINSISTEYTLTYTHAHLSILSWATIRWLHTPEVPMSVDAHA